MFDIMFNVDIFVLIIFILLIVVGVFGGVLVGYFICVV